MKTRIPRKLKKQIPIGPYCYKCIGEFTHFKDGSWGFKIKPCPFYEQRSEGIFGGHCKLENCKVMDQVKSCDIKKGY